MTDFKEIIREAVWFLVLLLIIFIYCEPNKYKIPQEEPIKDEIFSIISTIDLKDPKNFYSIPEIEKLGEKHISILQELIESKSVSERWAAVVLLPIVLRENKKATNEIVIPALKKRIGEENDSLRMLVGAQLVSLGEKEGLKVLISCLDSERPTNFGQSLEFVKDRALVYLQYYTNYKGKTIKEWQKWWEENKDFLLWNKEKQIFEIK